MRRIAVNTVYKSSVHCIEHDRVEFGVSESIGKSGDDDDKNASIKKREEMIIALLECRQSARARYRLELHTLLSHKHTHPSNQIQSEQNASNK